MMNPIQFNRQRLVRTSLVVLLLVMLAVIGGQWGTARADTVTVIAPSPLCESVVLATVQYASPFYWAPNSLAIIPYLQLLPGSRWFICTAGGQVAGWIPFRLAPEVPQPLWVPSSVFGL